MHRYGTKPQDRSCCPGHSRYPRVWYSTTSARRRRQIMRAAARRARREGAAAAKDDGDA